MFVAFALNPGLRQASLRSPWIDLGFVVSVPSALVVRRFGTARRGIAYLTVVLVLVLVLSEAVLVIERKLACGRMRQRAVWRTERAGVGMEVRGLAHLPDLFDKRTRQPGKKFIQQRRQLVW